MSLWTSIYMLFLDVHHTPFCYCNMCVMSRILCSLLPKTDVAVSRRTWPKMSPYTCHHITYAAETLPPNKYIITRLHCHSKRFRKHVFFYRWWGIWLCPWLCVPGPLLLWRIHKAANFGPIFRPYSVRLCSLCRQARCTCQLIFSGLLPTFSHRFDRSSSKVVAPSRSFLLPWTVGQTGHCEWTKGGHDLDACSMSTLTRGTLEWATGNRTCADESRWVFESKRHYSEITGLVYTLCTHEPFNLLCYLDCFVKH